MKIALIAMSGVRACDQELLALGLTLPGFVERSKTIASLPSLGLLTLAGMTPRRHQVCYYEVDQLSDADALPDDFDLVAISTFTAQARAAYQLAQRFTSREIPVVMGGLHVTSVPEEAAAYGVVAAVGEGELNWPVILADVERGQIQPRYDSAGNQFSLADAPMPAFEMLDIERYNRLTVQTSRGCPWKCDFCASSILLTSRYKQKPMAKVLAEIDRIRELWAAPFIEFADDNSMVNRAYWKELLPQLQSRRIRWFAETDLSIWKDPELLTAMRGAGCKEVLIGFESPVETGLDGLESKCNWKKAQWPAYRKAIRTIQSHGIRVNACFVLGLNGHTPAVFEQVYRFVEETTPFDVQITYFTPFPGTPAYRRLKTQNRLRHDGEWERFTLFDINYKPAPMSAEELRAGFLELGAKLYSDSFTNYRRDGFRRQRASRCVSEASSSCLLFP